MVDTDKIFRPRPLVEEDPGKFMLTVYMPQPWGIGKNSFFVDDIDYVKPQPDTPNVIAIRGIIGEDRRTVVVFSSNFEYTLIERGQFETVTLAQIKAEHKQAHEDMKCEDEDEQHTGSGRALSGGIAL